MTDIEHDLQLLQRNVRTCITNHRRARCKVANPQTTTWQKPPLNEGKCLIFTQYADTARYLFENLNPNGERDDVDVIYSGDKSKERAVGRFAPKANPRVPISARGVGIVLPSSPPTY